MFMTLRQKGRLFTRAIKQAEAEIRHLERALATSDAQVEHLTDLLAQAARIVQHEKAARIATEAELDRQIALGTRAVNERNDLLCRLEG